MQKTQAGQIVWVVTMKHAVHGQHPISVHPSKKDADVFVMRYPGGQVTPVQAYPPSELG
jgi:hypothetical protein